MKLYTIICGAVCLICSVVVPEHALCQSAQESITAGRVLVAAAGNTGNSRLFDRVRYNPAVIYAGPNGSKVIYYHYPRNPVWRAGINRDLDGLTCRAAQDSLRRTGLWMGHLKPDGSCGDTAEPIEWAVGNWLNFNAAR